MRMRDSRVTRIPRPPVLRAIAESDEDSMANSWPGDFGAVVPLEDELGQ